jgi:hypothetical protein
MKKISGLICAAAVIMFIGCGNEKEKEVQKEVIIVPAKDPPPAEKNTTISLDKNGVKVSTKKLDVKIDPDRKKN